MTQCIQPARLSSYRKRRQDKRQRQLKKLKRMREAKARIRQERIAAGLMEREPKLERFYPFRFGVQNKLTGETAWHDLVSVRYAAKALGLILKYCA